MVLPIPSRLIALSSRLMPPPLHRTPVCCVVSLVIAAKRLSQFLRPVAALTYRLSRVAHCHDRCDEEGLVANFRHQYHAPRLQKAGRQTAGQKAGHGDVSDTNSAVSSRVTETTRATPARSSEFVYALTQTAGKPKSVEALGRSQGARNLFYVTTQRCGSVCQLSKDRWHCQAECAQVTKTIEARTQRRTCEAEVKLTQVKLVDCDRAILLCAQLRCHQASCYLLIKGACSHWLY